MLHYLGAYGNYTYSTKKQPKKWDVPSYLQSDDDDETILDGSAFIKKSAKSTKRYVLVIEFKCKVPKVLGRVHIFVNLFSAKLEQQKMQKV